jgi:hypothetical protein
MAMAMSGIGRTVRLSVLVLLLLGMSLPGAGAQGRRGALVRVDMKDGAQVQGELVVVGGSSLIVRDRSGAETSYEFGGIARVTVTWSKKKFPGGFVGFAAGAAAGYLVGANPRNWAHDEDVLVLRGIGTGILWGALGAVVGSAATSGRHGARETVFPIEGLSDRQLQETLKNLKKHARIRS